MRLAPWIAAPLVSTLAIAASADPPAFVVRDVRVFDGERLLPAQDVPVVDGRIAARGRGLKVRAGTAEVEGAGRTLLPGLVDAHTHDWGDSPREALLFGVTTELNMGTPPAYVAGLRAAEAAGQDGD